MNNKEIHKFMEEKQMDININSERNLEYLGNMKDFSKAVSIDFNNGKEITINDFFSSELAGMSILATCVVNGINEFSDIVTDAQGMVYNGDTVIDSFYSLDDIMSICYEYVVPRVIYNNRHIEVTIDMVKATFQKLINELWDAMVHEKKVFYIFKYITPFGRSIKAYEYRKSDYGFALAEKISSEIRSGADFNKLVEMTTGMIVNLFTNGDFTTYFNGNMNQLSENLRYKVHKDAMQLIIEVNQKINGGIL